MADSYFPRRSFLVLFNSFATLTIGILILRDKLVYRRFKLFNCTFVGIEKCSFILVFELI